MERADEFNLSDDVMVEFSKFFGRDPVLPVFSRAGNLDGEPGEIIGFDLKAKNVPGSTITRIPVTCNLDRIALFEDRVKDGLFREPRRKGPPICSTNQFEFFFAGGPIEGCRSAHIFSVTCAKRTSTPVAVDEVPHQ